jgi:TolB-like protein/rhodanese-related sulfurtransferase/Flp pilus assembly protein TadD
MVGINQDVPDEGKILFRIGINLGDVIEDDGDIYGDGVNVAARLQGLAEPGGICVSDTVHSAIGSKLPLDYVDLGEQEVKNIAEPVRAYQLRLKPGAELPRPSEHHKPVEPSKAGRWQPITAALVIALIVAGGGLTWLKPWEPREEAASVENMAYPLPDKPSIAVLPLDNMSDDPSQDYFADGMTEDLITDLSKNPGLFVIARNSSFSYKGQNVKIRQVAEELGVRYVLEGSVRRVGDKVRINAQLIDATTGGHLWAERYDGTLADVFTLQDNVVRQIVAALAVNLTTSSSAHADEVETDVPQAYDAFLRGWSHYLLHTREDYASAIDFFNEAVTLDPDYSRAYAGLARIYWDMSNLGWEGIVDLEWEQGLELALSYLDTALQQPTPEAYAIQAEMFAMQGKHELALIEIGRALTLSPSSSNYVSKAKILNSVGQAEESEIFTRTAMRLDPNALPQILRTLGRSLLHQGRFEEAAEALERALTYQSDHYSYATLAVVYGHLGRFEDAQQATEKYNKIVEEWNYTPLTVQEIRLWWDGDMFFYNPDYVKSLAEGLRKAGVPEGAAPQTESFDFISLVSNNDRLYNVEGATRIDSATAKLLHDRGIPFVDVRDAGSFARRHIPGAVNLDLNLDFVEQNLTRVVGKNEEVVIHCWAETCSWGPYACAKAVLWGFERVYYFAGGVPAWVAADYPVEANK